MEAGNREQGSQLSSAVFYAMKRHHYHGNSEEGKQLGELALIGFSPLLSRQEGRQHRGRHGAEWAAESSTLGF